MSETETSDASNNASNPLKLHQKQLPTPIFFGVIMVAALGILWTVGRFLPQQTPTPGLHDAPPTTTATTSEVAGTPEPRIDAPAITGKTADGKAFDLKDYQGKVVLLNYWATWCGPCRAEMPELVELQKQYASKDFAIIGMAEEDDPAKVVEFAKVMGLNYPQVMTTPEMAKTYAVDSLPTSFLIDKKGKVIVHMAGVPQSGVTDIWTPQIEKALAE
jgi:cytochrome c biogenesis protein CcmG, thiol:disulfide interchange protein DsbE